MNETIADAVYRTTWKEDMGKYLILVSDAYKAQQAARRFRADHRDLNDVLSLMESTPSSFGVATVSAAEMLTKLNELATSYTVDFGAK